MSVHLRRNPHVAVILVVGLFYMLLGGAVVGELRKKKVPA
jgi:hypothetical protein